MATQKTPSRRSHNKMVRRNLDGLLSKAYKYGQLQGVEVALYVDYTDREDFLFYESKGFVCRIAEKKGHPKSKRYLPSEVERLIRSKNVYKNKKAKGRRNPLRVGIKADETSLEACDGFSFDEFPELPQFNLSILGKCW